jgi:alpha-mannosidase
MPSGALFEGISVLIPGYAVEDLPTDLAEDAACSLLNAFAVAWHPDLIHRSRGIPVSRHPDAVRQLTGRQIVLIPTPTESWLPHDWQLSPPSPFHSLFRNYTTRAEWLDAVREEIHAVLTVATELNSGLPSSENTESSAQSCDDLQPAECSDVTLISEFLAFGTTWLMTRWLSRRRHHFVDPDEFTLSREIHLAADAAVAGDSPAARHHLKSCFTLLHETREQFFPMTCTLVDLCIPSATADPETLADAVLRQDCLNLVATAGDLLTWAEKSSAFRDAVRSRLIEKQLSLLTGPELEVRPSLSPLAATLDDLVAGSDHLLATFGQRPQHWARRRFGLVASLPMILRHLGYQSALHVALDDGLYPDQERSQFEWQSADSSTVLATSRIPLAIDSSASFLRFAERCNESMQDEDSAVLFLARLPEVQLPWLSDLRIAAAFAPVLGAFITVDQLWSSVTSHRTRLKFDHGEYLSPGLIQASVIRTENPVTSPAEICCGWYDLIRAATLQAFIVILSPQQNEQDSTDVRKSEQNLSLKLSSLRQDLRTLENQRADLQVDESQRDASQNSFQEFRATLKILTFQMMESLAARLQLKSLPADKSPDTGLLVVNTLPFARSVILPWSSSSSSPEKHPAIQGCALQNSELLISVQLPPGGYVQLSPAQSAATAHPMLTSSRREPPLAENLVLRNKHFEVTLSETTGGIASVYFFNERGNRLSQRIGFRYEREQRLQQDSEQGDPGRTNYALTRLKSSRVLDSGPLVGSVETMVELLAPSDGTVIALVRQTTTVDRFRMRIQIRFQVDDLFTEVRGNPWMTYLGCRFAWESETAGISRSVVGQAAGFRSERFESPDYFEVTDQSHRFVVATHGRPVHRRSGPRSVDSILICEGEPGREFVFTVDFDQPFPMRTALDACCDALVMPTESTRSSLPGSSQPVSCWLLGLSAKNVVLADVRVQPLQNGKDSVRVFLLETEGADVECLIRTARTPLAASVLSYGPATVTPLTIDSRGVVVPLRAFQMREVELKF